MSFTLPDLPYDKSALSPHISAETLSFHHDKHHAAYVNKLNELIKDTKHETQSLEEVIQTSSGPIFNNAAQVWNHTFYWHCMKKNGGGKPTGKIAKKIDEDLGGYEEFKKQFTEAALTQFGSGWAWLVLDSGKLKIVKTSNAENPMTSKQIPLLTIDVWEHAYYLDYQNKRPDYVGIFLNNLVNWDFAEENLSKAK